MKLAMFVCCAPTLRTTRRTLFFWQHQRSLHASYEPGIHSGLTFRGTKPAYEALPEKSQWIRSDHTFTQSKAELLKREGQRNRCPSWSMKFAPILKDMVDIAHDGQWEINRGTTQVDSTYVSQRGEAGSS